MQGAISTRTARQSHAKRGRDEDDVRGRDEDDVRDGDEDDVRGRDEDDVRGRDEDDVRDRPAPPKRTCSNGASAGYAPVYTFAPVYKVEPSVIIATATQAIGRLTESIENKGAGAGASSARNLDQYLVGEVDRSLGDLSLHQLEHDESVVAGAVRCVMLAARYSSFYREVFIMFNKHMDSTFNRHREDSSRLRDDMLEHIETVFKQPSSSAERLAAVKAMMLMFRDEDAMTRIYRMMWNVVLWLIQDVDRETREHADRRDALRCIGGGSGKELVMQTARRIDVDAQSRRIDAPHAYELLTAQYKGL